MKKQVFTTLLFVLIALMAAHTQADAQCSMCSAAAESSARTGDDVALGLNSGILYLMGVPYVLLIGLGILLFRRLNANKAES